MAENTTTNTKEKKEYKAPKLEKKKVRIEDLRSSGASVEVVGLASVSKAVQSTVIEMDRTQVRFLVDNYYQTQDQRKAADNQVRALIQGYDKSLESSSMTEEDETDSMEPMQYVPSAMVWLAANKRSEETQIKKMLDAYTDSDPLGRWLKATIGIGPVIAAGLMSYFDINKAEHFSQFWSYAGLNDNNTPWLGREKSAKWVSEWLKAHPDANKKDLGTDIVVDACAAHHRTYETSIRQATDKDSGLITASSVQAWLAKPPYNRELKTLCWKIGQSFLKVKNKKNSLYGRLLNTRLVYEKQKNENGDYAEQAANILKTKTFKNQQAKKVYESGKLPDGHILSRCLRHTTKIFIAHLFEAMYFEKYGEEPPRPYAIEYLGHVDVIPPEVDYHEYF